MKVDKLLEVVYFNVYLNRSITYYEKFHLGRRHSMTDYNIHYNIKKCLYLSISNEILFLFLKGFDFKSKSSTDLY